MEICEGGTESGTLEIEVEESKGGTGGKGRGGFRGCVGECGLALSSTDRSGGSGLCGRSQSGGGIVGVGKSLCTI
jgi:hypothetical protein